MLRPLGRWIQMAEEAMQQTSGEYELAGHPELRISQGPFLVVFNTLFVDKVYGHRAPIPSQIIEEESGNADFSATV